jgi:hypothetical protein
MLRERTNERTNGLETAATLRFQKKIRAHEGLPERWRVKKFLAAMNITFDFARLVFLRRSKKKGVV